MYLEGLWVGVCYPDRAMRRHLEQIACKQLGYNHTRETKSWGLYSRPKGVIVPGCNGTEHTLFDCAYKEITGQCQGLAYTVLSCKHMILPKQQFSESPAVELPYKILNQQPLDQYQYDGFYTIQVPKDHSLLVKVARFFLPKSTFDKDIQCDVNVRVNYLLIWEENTEDSNKTQGQPTQHLLCAYGTVPLLVFRRTVHMHVQMYTWDSKTNRGYMLSIEYSVLPTNMEPTTVQPSTVQPTRLFNCSVPHFDRFRSLLSCNWFQECVLEEDERGCRFYLDYNWDRHCGETAVAIGEKCYTVVMVPASHTWYQAHKLCLDRGQRLGTLNDPKSFQRFSELAKESNIHDVFLGLKVGLVTTKLPLAYLYRHIWRSSQGNTFFALRNTVHKIVPRFTVNTCLLLTNWKEDRTPGHKLTMYRHECDQGLQATFNLFLATVLCEFDPPGSSRPEPVVAVIKARNQSSEQADDRFQSCTLGHVTKRFLACDSEAMCGAQKVMTSCALSGRRMAMFVCEFGGQSVPFSLVCDHIVHCTDGSDERFCRFQPCLPSSFKCWSGQCVRKSAVCDATLHCYDQTDETVCREDEISSFNVDGYVPRSVITLDGKGTFNWTLTSTCPESHFRCPSDGFCLPVYLLCNGVQDCTGSEDEVMCESYTCPGFYRCRSSRVCLHPDQVCDGVFQCPDYDDELLCDLPACPTACHCQGLAYVCTDRAFSPPPLLPHLRYLDVSHTNVSAHDLVNGSYLVLLYLSSTGMRRVPVLKLSNLRMLDVSYNSITAVSVQAFRYLSNLRVLTLEGNPLLQITSTPLSDATGQALNTSSVQDQGRDNEKTTGPLSLQEINLSHTYLTEYNGSVLAGFPELSKLNLSHSGLHTITVEGFSYSPALTVFDARGSPLSSFPVYLLKNLRNLQAVYVYNFRLCCKDVLPSLLDPSNCHAVPDPLSSCQDLVSSSTYLTALWTFSVLAIVGNAVSLAVNVLHSFVLNVTHNTQDAKVFGMLVTNLNLADLTCGVYAGVVGVSDAMYRGQYLWHDVDWRESAACTVAGVLFVTSRQVSVITICLTVLHRISTSQLRPCAGFRFRVPFTAVVCFLTWTVGLVLATIPLAPLVSHWQFYRQSAVCVPLLVSATHSPTSEFKGRSYYLGVLMVNFALFSVIAVAWTVSMLIGQCSRGARDRVTVLSSNIAGRMETDLARRLKLIVVTDFLCWFPVGLLVLFSGQGTEISEEVLVGATLILLPVNSAINPLLYAYSVFTERRHARQTEKLLRRLKAANKAARVGNKKAGQVDNPRQTLNNAGQSGVSAGCVNPAVQGTVPTGQRQHRMTDNSDIKGPTQVPDPDSGGGCTQSSSQTETQTKMDASVEVVSH